MKCVSLFSGAGGLDLGLEAAGFDIVASIEQDSDCCKTLIQNGRVGVVERPVSQGALDEIRATHPSIDLLVGGPPCQPFSKSALWTAAGVRGLNDPRAKTLNDYFAAVAILRPRAFLLENVTGFQRWGGFAALEQAIAELNNSDAGLGYRLTSAVINAAEYGVPQRRQRFFVVGVRDGHTFTFPAPDAGKERTVWDACSAIPSNPYEEDLQLRGRWADLLPTIPPGENYLFHTERGNGKPLFGWRTRYWSFLYKLAPDLPSPTIVASPSQNSGPFHWANRLLSTTELAAIQTFPMDYKFSGDRPSRQRQIGNAVPPLLAERLGRALALHLGGRVAPQAPFVHSVEEAASTSVTPALAELPEKYRGLIGDHAAHPGPGLGPKGRVPLATPPTEAPA